MRVKKIDRIGGLIAAAFLASGIALGAGQTMAQSLSGGSKSAQTSARQKEQAGSSAGQHSVTNRKENQQRQKAMKSGASDNAPPKTVP